ncbi:putative serine/threonine-protein kinase PBL18 [Cocos nucifera]|uniref:Putative serine/threonine-protein kinase PBL18 n=1 Tax=Cocos nucifera TaxID=13894 RepID=A0A8K0IYS7_COCNU|nr:putative serine/threonine-protein kinase PBL18 [Cocos nucifera]
MGCFTVLRCKKGKKQEQFVNQKPNTIKEYASTALPEPETHGLSLRPSFRTMSKPIYPVNRVTVSRHRALSAPPRLDVAEGVALPSMEFDDHGESKINGGLAKDQRSANPLPLPLPSPEGSSALKSLGSFKSSNASNLTLTSGPLPLPPLAMGLRNFSFEEISAACQHFLVDRCVSEGISSTVYKATFGDDASSSKKLEATVSCLLPSSQGLKEFMNEVNRLASLQHAQLCRILGFCAHEGSDERMLVYERLYHGGLDQLLYARWDGPLIDWCARIKVALCAAQGLAFLHEEGPFQAMYNEFSTANIQIDKDFSAKLSGFGCVSYNPETEISNTSAVKAGVASLPEETLERGLLTPKSNVWSFGIVLLELLTGRKNNDSRRMKEERNIVKWSRPYLTDDCRLSLIMDPRLKGRFPPKAARAVADIALKCLQKDPSERPTMRNIVECLKNVQEMKNPCRFPLQEPAAVAGKQMLRSPSLSGIITPSPWLTFSPSPPSRTQSSFSPSRPSITLPLPRSCASSLSVEDARLHILKKLPSLRRPGVEGF